MGGWSGGGGNSNKILLLKKYHKPFTILHIIKTVATNYILKLGETEFKGKKKPFFYFAAELKEHAQYLFRGFFFLIRIINPSNRKFKRKY